MTRETFLSKSRIILLNSVLSARSLYTISIFKLPTLSLKKDQIRRKFLWNGPSLSKKVYNLVDWRQICIMREERGLGYWQKIAE